MDLVDVLANGGALQLLATWPKPLVSSEERSRDSSWTRGTRVEGT